MQNHCKQQSAITKCSYHIWHLNYNLLPYKTVTEIRKIGDASKQGLLQCLSLPCMGSNIPLWDTTLPKRLTVSTAFFKKYPKRYQWQHSVSGKLPCRCLRMPTVRRSPRAICPQCPRFGQTEVLCLLHRGGWLLGKRAGHSQWHFRYWLLALNWFRPKTLTNPVF